MAPIERITYEVASKGWVCKHFTDIIHQAPHRVVVEDKGYVPPKWFETILKHHLPFKDSTDVYDKFDNVGKATGEAKVDLECTKNFVRNGILIEKTNLCEVKKCVFDGTLDMPMVYLSSKIQHMICARPENAYLLCKFVYSKDSVTGKYNGYNIRVYILYFDPLGVVAEGRLLRAQELSNERRHRRHVASITAKEHDVKSSKQRVKRIEQEIKKVEKNKNPTLKEERELIKLKSRFQNARTSMKVFQKELVELRKVKP